MLKVIRQFDNHATAKRAAITEEQAISVAERFAVLAQLQQRKYGPTLFTDRLQRVLEVIECPWG